MNYWRLQEQTGYRKHQAKKYLLILSSIPDIFHIKYPVHQLYLLYTAISANSVDQTIHEQQFGLRLDLDWLEGAAIVQYSVSEHTGLLITCQYLFLKSPQLLAQVVVDFHELLDFGLRRSQGFLHLQIFLQRDRSIRKIRRVHALKQINIKIN